MEYVLRCLLSGLLFMLSGFIFGTVFWSRRERKFRERLDAARDELTEPESYIWVNVEDRLPVHDREYIVEYTFESNSNIRFHSIHDFMIRENRFQHEGFHGLKVVRWAELPK